MLASVLSQARIKVPTFIWATKQDESYCDAYQLVVRIMAALKFPILQERFNERGWVVQPVSAHGLWTRSQWPSHAVCPREESAKEHQISATHLRDLVWHSMLCATID